MESKNTQRSSAAESWLMIFNRFVIGIGVLAIVFFATGKALQLFKGGDDTVTREAQVSVEQTLVLISKDSDSFRKIQSYSDLETLFGDEVVFVSASEPAYVMTTGERRFEIGDIPGTDVELSSITSTQLVLKQAEEVIVFTLPNENLQ
ncbi:hypothetical protein N9850_10075 [Granulosicoccus sp.]|nr:hypothetical protein [Granulosicoccus sp.]MDB4224106.1 hypothetical protein [Granulosicoccus sp.]